MSSHRAKFGVGDVVHHKKFDYRGVVVDVDAVFQGEDAWYEQMALSRPPKERPWYRVLVDRADHTTYVAERHLESDPGGPVRHPLLDDFFDDFDGSRYVRKGALH